MIDQGVDGEFEGAGLSLIGVTDGDQFALLGVVRDEVGHLSSLRRECCDILAECCDDGWVFLQAQRVVERRGHRDNRKHRAVSPRPLELKVRTVLEVRHRTGCGTNKHLSLSLRNFRSPDVSVLRCTKPLWLNAG